jgi:cytochrome P450
VQAFALPFSAECLKSITGLTNMRFEDMNAWSQGMIDGIANYGGDPAIEARCNAATLGIDAAIDDMVPVLSKKPDLSLLGVMLECGMPMESVRANIKLAISGGRTSRAMRLPARVGAAHPSRPARARAKRRDPWLQAFEEYARWISPIGMSPRRIAKPWRIRDVAFEPEERVFLMFGSANRDEKHFDECGSLRRQPRTIQEHRLRRRPAFLCGAWASRAMVATSRCPRSLRG